MDTKYSSLHSLLKRLAPYLNSRRRKQLLLALIVMLISSIAEVFSLAAVLPFLAALVDPAQLWEYEVARSVFEILSISEPDDVLVPVTILFVIIAILAAGVRLLNLWINGRLAAAIGSDISCEAYRRTLLQPYPVHANRNSSAVIATLVGQVTQVVNGVLTPIFQLFASGLILLGLLSTLLIVDWKITVGISLLFSVAYSAIVLLSKKRLLENSRIHTSMNVFQVQALQEGLGAIRDVILDGSEPFYLNVYGNADRPIRKVIALSGFLATFPRYAMEAVAMVVIAGMALFLSQENGGLSAAIPILGAFALGAQRLLPALQQTYSAWAVIRSNRNALQVVLGLLEQPVSENDIQAGAIAFKLQHEISFEKVRFRYANTTDWILKNLNVSIKKGERIGIVGTTGSGKSTTLDLLLGLLVPTEGRVCVDGEDLNSETNPDRLLQWRRCVAHVPQTIYLADSSIAENIAFGRPKDTIDMEKVRSAAMRAQLSAFVESIPEGYDTLVGERGVRLSGGQRQRIGIARALYKEADILVFDEATSALDNATEAALMNTIDSLSRSLTIIIIAHRLSTVARCDRVLEILNGEIVSERTGDEILDA